MGILNDQVKGAGSGVCIKKNLGNLRNCQRGWLYSWTEKKTDKHRQRTFFQKRRNWATPIPK